jgi:predicted ATPase
MAGSTELVQLAATLGREFSYELLRAVAPCDEGVLRAELARLVEAELLFVRGRHPDARYQFKHALIQDAAYQSLLRKTRQQFHARIAEALEQHFPETCAAHPELLAHHCTQGNLVARAAENWARAGERAKQRGAAVEAVGHFRRGLELIRTLPESDERHAQEIRMHLGLGMALEWAVGSSAPEVDAHYAQVYALRQHSGWGLQLFPALCGRFRCWTLQAQHVRAQEVAEDLLAHASREHNTGFLVIAHRAAGGVLYFQGKHAEAQPHLEKVLAVAATAELRAAIFRDDFVDPWIISQAYLSLVLWSLGYPERAAEQSRQALRMAEGLDNTFGVAVALRYTSWLHAFCRDREATRATAERARVLATEKGFALEGVWARTLWSWTLAERGQGEQAVAGVRQGLADARARGASLARTYFLALLAEACARAGRPGEGLQALAEAQEFAESTGERFWLPEVHRLRGELLLQHDPGAGAAAEACFHQALEVARQQQARSLELRAALSLARLWQGQGRAQAAADLLAPVYGTFTEGLRTHDLQAARAFLEQGRPVHG